MKRSRGIRQQRMKAWFYRFYENNTVDTRFALEEFMDACGMDKDRTRDYLTARTCLSRYRKKFLLHVDEFFKSAQYKKAIEDGEADHDLFMSLVNAAMSYGIYPVYSDAAVNPGSTVGYRAMTIEDFVQAKKMRSRSIASEVRTTAPAFAAIAKQMPSLPGQYGQAPALPSPDGLLRPTCDACGNTYASQKNLVDHYERKRADGDPAHV